MGKAYILEKCRRRVGKGIGSIARLVPWKSFWKWKFNMSDGSNAIPLKGFCHINSMWILLGKHIGEVT